MLLSTSDVTKKFSNLVTHCIPLTAPTPADEKQQTSNAEVIISTWPTVMYELMVLNKSDFELLNSTIQKIRATPRTAVSICILQENVTDVLLGYLTTQGFNVSGCYQQNFGFGGKLNYYVKFNDLPQLTQTLTSELSEPCTENIQDIKSPPGLTRSVRPPSPPSPQSSLSTEQEQMQTTERECESPGLVKAKIADNDKFKSETLLESSVRQIYHIDLDELFKPIIKHETLLDASTILETY